jgi:predicted P-loop ATPase
MSTRQPDLTAPTNALAENSGFPVTISRFTTGNPKDLLGKEFKLDENGKIEKHSHVKMHNGVAEHCVITSFGDLWRCVESLAANQALGLGLADSPQVQICTKSHPRKGAVSRTKDNINLPNSSGFALFDFDLDLEKYTPETREVAESVLAKVEASGYLKTLGELAEVDFGECGYLDVPSSSGGVREPGGKIQSATGRHIYIVLKDATDAPRFVRALHERMWERGFGWLQVTADGKVLARSMIDIAVAAPERLIFEAKPVVHPPLEYEERVPAINEGQAFDSSSVKGTPKFKAKVTGAAKSAERTLITGEVEDLPASTKIVCENQTVMTVGELFLGRKDMDSLYDPYEGTVYGHTCAKFFFNGGTGACRLHSQAHGGRTFRLEFDQGWLEEFYDALPTDDQALIDRYRNDTGLIQNQNGILRAINKNVEVLLRTNKALAGCVGFDQFRNRVVLMRKAPWGTKPGEEWLDNDDIGLAMHLQANFNPQFTVGIVRDPVNFVAWQNLFNPLCDHLDGLVWDGEQRVGDWLATYLGCASTPYTQTVGKRWVIGAVARAFKPGCQNDTMLILEGKQGAGKSSALRLLAGGEWFTDHLPELTGKDAMAQLDGIWIAEMSELASVRGAKNLDRIKAFLTQRVDRYRASYAKRAEDHPRTTVFAGSVNPDGSGYLSDQTGNRRFWPVEVGVVDLAGLERDRDQIWAEAVRLYRAGEPWWLIGDEQREFADAEQERRTEDDEWEELIQRFVWEKPMEPQEGAKSASIVWTPRDTPLMATYPGEVLKGVFGIRDADKTPVLQKRVTRILKKLGFEKQPHRTLRHIGAHTSADGNDGRRKWWRLGKGIDPEALRVRPEPAVEPVQPCLPSCM